MRHCNFNYEGITGKMTIKLRLGEGEILSNLADARLKVDGPLSTITRLAHRSLKSFTRS